LWWGRYERVPALPSAPTTAESGMPELEVITWCGLFVPAGVRPEIVARLGTEMNRIWRAPELRRALARVEIEPAPSSPPEFEVSFRKEGAKWAHVIRDADIRVE